MNTVSKRLTLALVLSLAIVPSVSGCSVQSIIQNATGGNVDVGGKAVPKDFPSDVPLIDGEVIYGAALGNSEGKVWNVSIKVTDVTAFDTISGQLEGAGFTEPTGLGEATADGATGAFDGEKYGVLVVVSTDGDNGFVANYTVTTKN